VAAAVVAAAAAAARRRRAGTAAPLCRRRRCVTARHGASRRTLARVPLVRGDRSVEPSIFAPLLKFTPHAYNLNIFNI